MGSSAGPIISGVGALSGLLTPNRGAQQAGAYRGLQMGELGGLQGLAGQYGGMADAARYRYGQYQPQQNAAYDALHQYYNTNPDTDQQFTMDTQRAQQNSRSAYDAARAGVQSSLARRGFSDAGGLAAGGTQGVDLAQAADQSQAGQYAAQMAAQRRAANLQGDYGLTTGQTGQAYDQQNQAMGQQSELERILSSEYGGMADQAQQMGMAQAQNGMQGLEGFGQGLSQESAYQQALSKLYGGGGGGAAPSGGAPMAPVGFGPSPSLFPMQVPSYPRFGG